MNKKLMAVAVAGVLTAPAAFAQSSNVQLYGRANLGIDSYKATGATAQGVVPGNQIDYKSRIRIFDGSSRVGFRGTEDLGGGLKAIFQIETGVNVDGNSNTGQNGAINASTGFWATRDSYVGLEGGWGRVTMGRQSIWWANGLNGQHAANYTNTEIPWHNGTNLGRVGFPVARLNDVIAYTSPTFAGINGTLSYSPNPQEAVQHNLPTGTDTDGRIWGLTLRGTWGQFYAQYDYANAQQNSPNTATAVAAAEITGHKLGGSWGYMPGARVGLVYARVYNNRAQGVAAGQEARKDGWVLFWEHTFGQFQVLASYGQANDLKNCGTVTTIPCADSGAKGYEIGGRYFLSKRTWVYLTYNQVSNERNNFADFTGANITSVSPVPGGGATCGITQVCNTLTPYGADPKILALGLFHNF